VLGTFEKKKQSLRWAKVLTFEVTLTSPKTVISSNCFIMKITSKLGIIIWNKALLLNIGLSGDFLDFISFITNSSTTMKKYF